MDRTAVLPLRLPWAAVRAAARAQTTDQAVVLVEVVVALSLELVALVRQAKDPTEVLEPIPMPHGQVAAVVELVVRVALPPQTLHAALAVLALVLTSAERQRTTVVAEEVQRIRALS
jgi:hypothetical protein